MTEVREARTAKEKAEFTGFTYRVYRGAPEYRDNMNYSCKNFVYKTDAFAKECLVRPVVARENGIIAARCAYIIHPGLDAVQIGLFEALPGKARAVDMLLAGAKEFAAANNKDTVLIGINGHTSYGVGFLCDNFKTPNPFDGVYTKEYYPAYFTGRGFKVHNISTYYARSGEFSINERLLKKVRSRFAFRLADIREFDKEINILGPLFNETLSGTPLFFPRETGDWRDMLKDMRPLLKDENVIYAMENGREIGYVFWHPNYNTVLRGNGKNGTAGFFIKYLMRRRNIREFKINAAGVLPQYRNGGAIIGLFAELADMVRDRYAGGETGFVFDGNAASAGICRRFCGPAYRRYAVYEAKAGDIAAVY